MHSTAWHVPMARIGIPVVLLTLWSGALHGQQRVERDVVYRWYFGTALLMDVYYPSSSNGAGIIWINGSGFHAPPAYMDWELKNAERMQLAQVYLDAGFTLFSINHRAAPEFRYPAAVEDAQRAVRFVRAHAGRFGIDPALLAARGTSSGGHLASLLGTMDGAGDPDAPDPVDRLDSKVRAGVAIRASYDLSDSPSWPSATARAVTSFIGTTIEQAPQLFTEASPLSYVSSDDAAFLLIHGDADDAIPFTQAEEMRDSLKAVGVSVDFVRLHGAGHGWSPSVYDESHAAAWLTRELFGLQQASELEPVFNAHHDLIQAWAKVDVADLTGALDVLSVAGNSDPRVHVHASFFNRVCWRGGTRGRAEEVIHACERAVELDPSDFEIRESRGLARALLGDLEGAIKDFGFFLDHVMDPGRFASRSQWVDELKAGRNPFTNELLRELGGGD